MGSVESLNIQRHDADHRFYWKGCVLAERSGVSCQHLVIESSLIFRGSNFALSQRKEVAPRIKM